MTTDYKTMLCKNSGSKFGNLDEMANFLEKCQF